MVKSQSLVRPVLHPFGHRSIVTGSSLGTVDASEEGDRAGMPARIAVWVRVYANEAKPGCLNPGLLQELATTRRFDGLADFDKSARESIHPFEWRIFALHKQYSLLRIDDNAVDG